MPTPATSLAADKMAVFGFFSTEKIFLGCNITAIASLKPAMTLTSV